MWVGYYDGAANTGVFRRLDGATGQQLDEVTVPNGSGLSYGPYGGAVTKEGDFVVVGWQLGPLIRIDADTLQVDRWPFPQPPQVAQAWSYGMALDPDGNPWIAGAGSAVGFDFASQQWTVIPTTNQSMRGVMVDREWRAWYAVDASAGFGCGLAVVDTKNKTLLQDLVPLPGCSTPVGASIDVDGYVWVVDQGANVAFKVDPDTYQVDLTVTGLVAPYTYSDMTGGGLGLVVDPPRAERRPARGRAGRASGRRAAHPHQRRAPVDRHADGEGSHVPPEGAQKAPPGRRLAKLPVQNPGLGHGAGVPRQGLGRRRCRNLEGDRVLAGGGGHGRHPSSVGCRIRGGFPVRPPGERRFFASCIICYAYFFG